MLVGCAALSVVAAVVLVLVLAWWIRRSVIRPVVEAAAAGDFSQRGDALRFEHDFRVMIENLNTMMQVSDDNLQQISALLARMTLDDVLGLRVRNTSGGMVPLREVVSAQWSESAQQIQRFQGFAAVRISGGAAAGVSSGAVFHTCARVASKMDSGTVVGIVQLWALSHILAPAQYGIISVALEYLCRREGTPCTVEEVHARIAQVPVRLAQIWRESDASGISSDVVADRMAQKLIGR